MEHSTKPKHGTDYYIENGLVVFTSEFHLKRGKCCGSKCRNCPYFPSHKKGSTTTKENFKDVIK